MQCWPWQRKPIDLTQVPDKLSHICSLSCTNMVIWSIAAATIPIFYVPSHKLNKMKCWPRENALTWCKSLTKFITCSIIKYKHGYTINSSRNDPRVFMFLLIQCWLHFFYTHMNTWVSMLLLYNLEWLTYLYIYIESQFKHFSLKNSTFNKKKSFV